jgi:pantothenate kinase, type III
MSTQNILLVDIGNTSTCVSVCNGKDLSRVVRSDTSKCKHESVREVIRRAANGRELSHSVLCSVVPAVNTRWLTEMKRVTGTDPILVNHCLNLGARLRYPNPATIGPDRLANICGAVARYGFPVMVADFGTAATFDVITASGSFAGGVIAPGLRMMTDYMAERTALLPRIKIVESIKKIGRNTEQAMQIGAVIGYRGLVREITEYLVKQNSLDRINLIATGGLARTVLKGLGLPYRIDPNLTLWGLYRIFELNLK